MWLGKRNVEIQLFSIPRAYPGNESVDALFSLSTTTCRSKMIRDFRVAPLQSPTIKMIRFICFSVSQLRATDSSMGRLPTVTALVPASGTAVRGVAMLLRSAPADRHH